MNILLVLMIIKNFTKLKKGYPDDEDIERTKKNQNISNQKRLKINEIIHKN